MTCSTVLSLVAATLALLPSAQANQPAAAEPDSVRMVQLAIVPAQLDPAKDLSLLPKPDELTDDDGAELYAKAAQALPKAMDGALVRNWLDASPSELPQADVQAVLQEAKPSLELAGRAARCRESRWPPFPPGTMPAHLTEYRDLARLLSLKAKLEISQKRYSDAIGTIQTGLAMARDLGEGPTVVQGVVGVAVGEMVLGNLKDLAQAPGSPNLYNALQALPRPLVDMNQPISSELEGLDSNSQYNELTRRVMQQRMNSSIGRVRQLMYRLDGTVASLQCVEALRHYAATHNGSLPAQLDDISEIKVPADPTADQPFAYRLEGSKAVLKVSPPKSGRPRDAVRYEITVAR